MKTLATALALATVIVMPTLAQQRIPTTQLCPSGAILTKDGSGHVYCRDYQSTRD